MEEKNCTKRYVVYSGYKADAGETIPKPECQSSGGYPGSFPGMYQGGLPNYGANLQIGAQGSFYNNYNMNGQYPFNQYNSPQPQYNYNNNFPNNNFQNGNGSFSAYVDVNAFHYGNGNPGNYWQNNGQFNNPNNYYNSAPSAQYYSFMRSTNPQYSNYPQQGQQYQNNFNYGYPPHPQGNNRSCQMGVDC